MNAGIILEEWEVILIDTTTMPWEQNFKWLFFYNGEIKMGVLRGESTTMSWKKKLAFCYAVAFINDHLI